MEDFLFILHKPGGIRKFFLCILFYVYMYSHVCKQILLIIKFVLDVLYSCLLYYCNIKHDSCHLSAVRPYLDRPVYSVG
jgi:hypothetical protein